MRMGPIVINHGLGYVRLAWPAHPSKTTLKVGFQ